MMSGDGGLFHMLLCKSSKYTYSITQEHGETVLYDEPEVTAM